MCCPLLLHMRLFSLFLSAGTVLMVQTCFQLWCRGWLCPPLAVGQMLAEMNPYILPPVGVQSLGLAPRLSQEKCHSIDVSGSVSVGPGKVMVSFIDSCPFKSCWVLMSWLTGRRHWQTVVEFRRLLQPEYPIFYNNLWQSVHFIDPDEQRSIVQGTILSVVH